MSDLFYAGFSDEEIAAVMGVMVLAAQHTYQILTKRPERMRDWFRRWTADDCLDVLARVTTPSGESIPGPREWNHPPHQEWYSIDRWPIPWIWLGVSVENQAAADQRIPPLLDTPAGVHFLSIEPMLGAVDVGRWLHCQDCPTATPDHYPPGRAFVGWVIVGCESGHRARPMPLDAARSVRDQCAAAGVPFFLKQACDTSDPAWHGGVLYQSIGAGPGSHRKGRNLIGAPYLDGVQHLAFPEVQRG